MAIVISFWEGWHFPRNGCLRRAEMFSRAFKRRILVGLLLSCLRLLGLSMCDSEACVGIVEVFYGYSPYRVLRYWLTLRMFLAVAGFYFRVEEASITAFHKWLLVHL